MSFLEKAIKAAKVVNDMAVENAENKRARHEYLRQIYDELSEKSNAELVKIAKDDSFFFGSTLDERKMAIRILKERRGY